uniref:Abhydrolase_3 domain-containing protein n=1 Tax=Macrostomum lignano TaxID=282301 RepID=A0A1I8JAB4_9PLAT
MTDEAGRLNLDSSCSVGGTYTGLDSMGLFWSLKQDPSQRTGLRLLRREAEIPLKYQLTALNGHVMWDELAGEQKPDSGHALCSIALERTYLSDSVERLPIKFGRLRGALFKPRSQRSCPPVIDLFGTGGGLMEHRSALLAKEGFSVLALAYFNYEDLPKELHEIDMDYFEEAVDFMLASPYSRLGPEGGLGLIGVSAGADIVANAAIMFGKKVRAVAWLNGNRCRSWFPVRYRARLVAKSFPDECGADGLDSREACCSGCTEAQELPVEKSTCRFLFLSSLDDYSMPVDTAERVWLLEFEDLTDSVELITWPIQVRVTC